MPPASWVILWNSVPQLWPPDLHLQKDCVGLETVLFSAHTHCERQWISAQSQLDNVSVYLRAFCKLLSPPRGSSVGVKIPTFTEVTRSEWTQRVQTEMHPALVEHHRLASRCSFAAECQGNRPESSGLV